MASESMMTTDHETIRKWAEARGGKPATVKGTESGGEAGILRINFAGYGDEEALEEISWDEFFQKFDEKQLVFLYQEETASGDESRFSKFISRNTAEHKSEDASHKLVDKSHVNEEKAPKTGHKSSEKSKAAHKSGEKSKSTHQ